MALLAALVSRHLFDLQNVHTMSCVKCVILLLSALPLILHFLLIWKNKIWKTSNEIKEKMNKIIVIFILKH